MLAGLPVSDSYITDASNAYCTLDANQNPICGSGTDDGAYTVARFGYPVACVLSGSYLYVTDAYYHAVRRVSISPTGGMSCPRSASLPT